MSCPTCRHTHANGATCGSPALRGEQFCFFHHPDRRTPRQATPHQTAFHIPAITNREDLQMACSEVIRRLADNTLDTKRASLLLRTLEMASANLGAWSPNLSRGVGEFEYPQTDPDRIPDSFRN